MSGGILRDLWICVSLYQRISKMTLEEIESLIVRRPGVLLYFSGEQCSVCHALRPKFNKIFSQDFPVIEQVYLDAKNNQEISLHYNVFSVPTILVFLDGKEFAREDRTVSLDILRQKLLRPYSILVS